MGVMVRSWSKNCANCMVINVYLECRLLMSGWMTVEITLGDGSGTPVAPVSLGLEIPSSYALGSSLVKVVKLLPKVGFLRLLQWPVKVL